METHRSFPAATDKSTAEQGSMTTEMRFCWCGAALKEFECHSEVRVLQSKSGIQESSATTI